MFGCCVVTKIVIILLSMGGDLYNSENRGFRGNLLELTEVSCDFTRRSSSLLMNASLKGKVRTHNQSRIGF